MRMKTADIQIQRQLAVALMMPSPRRVNDRGDSPQVLISKEYVIDRVHVDFTNHLLPRKAVVVPGLIEIRNQKHEDAMQAQQRFALVRRVWENWPQLPSRLQLLIRQHEEMVSLGGPVTKDCEQLISRIQREAGLLSSGVRRSDTDALPTLASLLDLGEVQEVEPSVEMTPVVEFDLGNIVRVPRRVSRAIIERRGQWSFRQGLLKAYGGRCQVTQHTGEPALEAAHIYPYSEGGDYTNDLQNGLLLRADIHTLFDLGMLKVAPSSLEVRIMAPLINSSYAALDGTVLQTSVDLQPSREALNYKWVESPT